MSLEAEIKFSFDFLSLLNASKESKFFSPISLLHSLSMIYVGANNNTAKQIADVIGKESNRQGIIEYYSKLIKSYMQSDNNDSVKTVTKNRKRLHSSSEKNEESVNIIIANKLFVSNDTSFLPEYEEIIRHEYGACKPEKLNFGDSVTSAKEINNFVYNTTKGVIKEIITPEDINSDMVAAIINAVYFQGFWEIPFKNREKRKFYSNPIRKIDMMTASPKDGDWNLRSGKGWEALGIPYKNRKTWMFIVLPKKKNGLSDLMKKMDIDFFKDVTTREKSKKLYATIPVIETTTELEFPQYLSKLGIIDAFNDSCDLTNMFDGDRQYKIGKAIYSSAQKFLGTLKNCELSPFFKVPKNFCALLYKAVITVDETGTVAAAATASFPQAQRAYGFFEADHPFLYFISTTENSESITPKNILFIGTFC